MGGSAEADGSLVWRLTPPPYQEIPSGKLKGMATLGGLVDPSCKECYDVRIHEAILGKYGVRFREISYYNYTQPEGKDLISKYGITFVPTMIVDGEMDEYYNFTPLKEVWDQVGSNETDGWHVFRNATALGSNVTFRNLTSGSIETVK